MRTPPVIFVTAALRQPSDAPALDAAAQLCKGAAAQTARRIQ